MFQIITTLIINKEIYKLKNRNTIINYTTHDFVSLYINMIHIFQIQILYAYI